MGSGGSRNDGEDSSENSIRSEYRFAVLGDAGVGKTSFCSTFENGSFPVEDVPDAHDSAGKEITKNERSVTVTLCDFPSEVSPSLLGTTLKGVDGIFLAFAADSPESFESMKSKWYYLAREHAESIRTYILAFKSELRPERTSALPDTHGDSDFVPRANMEKFARSIRAVGALDLKLKVDPAGALLVVDDFIDVLSSSRKQPVWCYDHCRIFLCLTCCFWCPCTFVSMSIPGCPDECCCCQVLEKCNENMSLCMEADEPDVTDYPVRV